MHVPKEDPESKEVDPPSRNGQDFARLANAGTDDSGGGKAGYDCAGLAAIKFVDLEGGKDALAAAEVEHTEDFELIF